MKRENIFMAYIKICMLSFLLFGFVNSLSSKDFKNGKELSDNSGRIISDSLRTEECSDSISVFATGSCVNTFENRTVSSTVSIQGCNTLVVQNVTITNNGNLTLVAPENITLNGPVVGELGSLLNIKIGQSQLMFEFIYDASGNRIMRQVSIVE